MFLSHIVRSRLLTLAQAGHLESWFVELLEEHAGRGLRTSAPTASPMFARLRQEEDHEMRDEVRALGRAWARLEKEQPVAHAAALDIFTAPCGAQCADVRATIDALQTLQSWVDEEMDAAEAALDA
jgi:hypothetical protein